MLNHSSPGRSVRTSGCSCHVSRASRPCALHVTPAPASLLPPAFRGRPRRQRDRDDVHRTHAPFFLPRRPLTPRRLSAQLAVLNAGSTLGRVLPVALAAAGVGVYTMLLPALLASSALVFALFGAASTAGVVAVAVLFGIASGTCTSPPLLRPASRARQRPPDARSLCPVRLPGPCTLFSLPCRV